jgi:hypothetical protein
MNGLRVHELKHAVQEFGSNGHCGRLTPVRTRAQRMADHRRSRQVDATGVPLKPSRLRLVRRDAEQVGFRAQVQDDQEFDTAVAIHAVLKGHVVRGDRCLVPPIMSPLPRKTC